VTFHVAPNESFSGSKQNYEFKGELQLYKCEHVSKWLSKAVYRKPSGHRGISADRV